MIKPHEVRIGNLVEYKGRIFKIDCISESLPLLDTAEFGAGVVEWKDLNPVPLTAEWLEKFDFEFYWMAGMCLIQLKVIEKLRLVRSYSHDISGDLKLDLRYDCLCTNIPQIKYIHQLQNIYWALSGKELPIKDNSYIRN